MSWLMAITCFRVLHRAFGVGSSRDLWLDLRGTERRESKEARIVCASQGWGRVNLP